MAIDTQATVNAVWGESVTYTRTGTGRQYSLTAGRHLQGTAEGVTSYGVYLIQKERYTLASDAVSFTPVPRDTIALDTDEIPRVIVSVNGSPFLKFWAVDCQYPCIAEDLNQLATVYRPMPLPTSEGFRDPGLSEVYVDVPVRLQPDTRSRELETAGRVTTRSRYVCVFGSAVVLNAGDTVRVGDVDYEVTEQSEVESLGVLTFAACERIT